MTSPVQRVLAAAITGVRAASTTSKDPAGDTATSAELWLYGVVGGYWFGFDAKSVADQLRGLDVDNLTVRLYSPGGSIIEGFAVGNLLANHKAHVKVVVDGMAASSASIIAVVGGDEIVMSPGAQMMLHDPWMLAIGNAKVMRQGADLLDKQAVNMATAYARRAGGDADAWRTVMTAEPDGTVYLDDEAVTAGLADRVANITSSSPPPAMPEDGGELDNTGEEMAARVALDLELVHPAARAAWIERISAHTSTSPRPQSAGGNTQPEGAAVVDLNDEQITALREQVGFPADADADTIVAAIHEALTERADDETPAPPSAPAALGAGMVAVPQAAWDEAQHNAQLGAQAAEQLRVQARESFLDAHADRFLPANRDAYRAQYDANPDGTRDYLEAAAVIVPLDLIGHQVDPPEASVQDDGWFPGWSTPTTKEA